MSNLIDEIEPEMNIFAGDIWTRSLHIAWGMIRVPVVFALVIIKPVVDAAFWALAILGVLMALFFKGYGLPADFPFIKMLAISACCALMPTVYGAVLRLIAK